MEWARILAYITGTVDQELLLRNEYLAAENRVLGGKLKGRRRKRRTELLHRGSLDNCHLCDRFNFLTIRAKSGGLDADYGVGVSQSEKFKFVSDKPCSN